MSHVPLATNMTSPAKWLTYANTASDGWFGITILIAVFVIVATHLARSFTPKAFTASALITLTVCLLLRWLQVVNGLVTGIVVVLFFLCVIWDGFSND